MKPNRMPRRPMFNGQRLKHRYWRYSVLFDLGETGQVTMCTVTAFRATGTDPLSGTARGNVPLTADLTEVVEQLAIEAMIAATEPDLFGSTQNRKVDLSDLA